jgi:hypothetical protein
MFDIMGVHYDRLKETIGLNEIFDKNDNENETEEAFANLRPNSPFKLKELLNNKFDPKKYHPLIDH